jgi:hypothetical protein
VIADDGTEEKKGNNRDIVTDGLQTILSCVSADNGKAAVGKLIKPLLTALNSKPVKEIDMEMACLSVVKDIVEKFGPDIPEDHEEIVKTLMQLLEHPNDAVRKRASVTYAPLVLVLDDKLFSNLMELLIKKIESSKKPDTYIQSVSAISRAAGVRVGPYLDKLVPKLESFCQQAVKEVESQGIILSHNAADSLSTISFLTNSAASLCNLKHCSPI